MHRSVRWAIVAAALLGAGRLSGQVVTFGSGCSGLLPAPTISYAGSLVPGQTGQIRLAGAPPGAFVFLDVGTSDTASAYGPLPFDLSVFAGVQPGCKLYTSASTQILLNAKPDGTLKVGFKVPSTWGGDLYFQWAVVESITPLRVVLTPGLQACLQTSPYPHAVLLAPDTIVDEDGSGSEPVTLDGSDSHTHEIGHALAGWKWKDDATLLPPGEIVTVPLALGTHPITLLVSDDHVPPNTTLASHAVMVVPATAVPGVSARYHDSGAADPATLLDAVPATADWAEILPGLLVSNGGGTVGGSPFGGQVMVRLRAKVALPAAASCLFAASGGTARRLEVDGAAVTGPLALAAGLHAVEARFAVPDVTTLPLAVTLALDGGPPGPVDAAALTHDQTALTPVINALTPAVGTTAGGNAVVIGGLGFFPAGAVVVHWGGVILTAAQGLQIEADEIRFDAPPHAAGTITVTVQAPSGTSNARTFQYSASGPVPVNFQTITTARLQSPTSCDFGPDGRLYVLTLAGELKAVTFDAGWNILDIATFPGVSALSNHHGLGLAFNPFDPPSPVRIYVSHGLLYADGGGVVIHPSTYHGAVSVLTGPSFALPQPLVTGLPQSNSGHAVNGLQFDDNGDLLLDVGCNTNAGVANLAMGSLPDSPLAGAVLKARTSRPDFNGAVHYLSLATGLPDDDQRSGGNVVVAPGSHVAVHAPGLRNPYDLVWTTTGRLYASDNGPNFGYGPASTGPASEIPDPETADEILLVEPGNYYGSPNRARALFDAREYVYQDPGAASLPGAFTQGLLTLAPSEDGLIEYRADTFGGQMRGELIVQKWNGEARRLRLAPDGRSIAAVTSMLFGSGALDVAEGPGGVLVVVDHTGSQLEVIAPVDGPAAGVEVLDIAPWRAPAGAAVPFVIGGRGFSTAGPTSVSIGGLPASVVSVGPTRIQGLLPAGGAPSQKLLDVTVVSAGQADTLPGAFRFLAASPGLEPGRWSSSSAGLPGATGGSTAGALPFAISDVAGGVIGDELILVNGHDPATLVLDVLQFGQPDAPTALGVPPAPNGAAWHTHAVRPFPGGAHAAEVVGDRLYLVGGTGAGSEGRVQIYDPAQDAWSLGASLPWTGGSVCTAAIAGKIYAAGGVAGGATVDACAVYDPATNAWTPRASLPFHQGRNHAASGTDGTRFFVIGGRGFGSGDAGQLADGFDTVQIYDPAANAWITSLDPSGPGAALAPLPVARGGLGHLVSWQGELYVIGGDTATGAGAGPGGVYDRVDVYDPAANAWRLEAPLPTPRAALGPVLFQGRVFVAGGSTTAAPPAGSAVLEIFARP